jgi:hypothetical protein
MPRKESKIEVISSERCMNRLISEKTIQYFGDGKHKFFLEQRCTERKMDGREICSKCSAVNTSKKQYARTFPRGLVNEPIPPDIHLFGGEWYNRNVTKWGNPADGIIRYALQFQREARDGFILENTEQSNPSKVLNPLSNSLSTGQDMPPRRKPVLIKEESSELSISNDVPKEIVKRVRRPRIAKTDTTVKSLPVESLSVDSPISQMDPVSTSYPPSESLPVLSLFQMERDTKKGKKEKKEKKEKEKEEEKEKEKEEKEKEEKEEKEEQTGKKKVSKRPSTVKTKKKESLYDKLVHPLPVVHKDSCIPTHLEETIEEESISDYESEIVTFSIFIHDNVVYFRDSKKNKLYRRMKEKTIGQYVGRYEPQTDTVVTDIPDSDDECE